ncbi:hypothetical protein GGR88_002670 [Sphingomonas jejuensis]|uniref:Secreted protein n=1 Tax=Sphingomonas jejuensis TaxID=904715 RepID=A0ABX0XP37_9SPHN|nr:hypothetical protein [Sphingomonas jejuensis]NJC35156.1 hypothetical protein [Sphingomonas jejuensis]
MMVKSLGLAGAALVAALSVPAPVAAQAGNERVVVVFGNDPCPTNSSGDDITICVRRDENERYRIPQELREPINSPENESWASRAQAYEYVGASGTNSCSPTGAGGWTGCYQQMVRQAREERRQATGNPDPVP